MAKLLDFGSLSIWEVAHQWEHVDPDDGEPSKLTKQVRERMRQLLQAISYGLLAPYDMNGERIPTEELWFTGIRKSGFAKRLDGCLYQRVYDKQFLNSVFLQQDEAEKWCWRMNQALPVFWFSDHVNRWGRVAGDESEPKQEVKSVSSVAKKAAQKRHEPVNHLKEEFFSFYEKGRFSSRAAAARRFYASLSSDKSRLLSKDNAVRTLTAALSKHLQTKG